MLKAFAFVVSLSLVGCGGFSTQEAMERCEEEETARAGGGCFSATTYDSCTAAYEDCGSDAIPDEGSCPLTYSCAE